MRAGDRAPASLGHREGRGPGPGVRTPDGARRVAPGPPGMRKGRRGLQPGQGRRAGRIAAQGWSWVPDLALWPRPLGAGPALAAFSFWILRYLTRSPAESRPSDPRAPRIVPGRQGGGPRRAADLGAHFPRSRVCARSRSRRGRSGRAPTFPRPRTAGTGVRDLWRRVPSGGLRAGACWNLR